MTILCIHCGEQTESDEEYPECNGCGRELARHNVGAKSDKSSNSTSENDYNSNTEGETS